MTGHVEIEMDESTLKQGASFGFVKLCPDGVYELTDKGKEFMLGFVRRARQRIHFEMLDRDDD